MSTQQIENNDLTTTEEWKAGEWEAVEENLEAPKQEEGAIFEIGDVVALKSGSPKMVVTQITPDSQGRDFLRLGAGFMNFNTNEWREIFLSEKCFIKVEPTTKSREF